MPRFNRKRWSPSHDSSAGRIQQAIVEKRIHLDIAAEWDAAKNEMTALGCPCGCGDWPKGSKAIFGMGHDARLRGILIRAHLTGTPIVRHLVAGGATLDLVAESAKDLASLYGASFTSALEAAELRREGKEREVLARALGSKRLLRVGRWEYTGLVAAIYGEAGDPEYEMEYVTKSGETKRRRVPANETVEVMS